MKTKHTAGFTGELYTIVEGSNYVHQCHWALLYKQRRYKSIRAALQALKDLRANGLKVYIVHYYTTAERELLYQTIPKDGTCYLFHTNAIVPYVQTRDDKLRQFQIH